MPDENLPGAAPRRSENVRIPGCLSLQNERETGQLAFLPPGVCEVVKKTMQIDRRLRQSQSVEPEKVSVNKGFGEGVVETAFLLRGSGP